MYWSVYPLVPGFWLMHDVSKSLAFTDPISAVFELNEDVMKRMGRFMFLIEYAHMGGIIVAFVSALLALLGILSFWPLEYFVYLGLLFAVSLLAWWFGRQEVRFLDELRLRSGALSRAKNWEPHPPLPSGPDPLERLLKYLQEQDNRFARIYAKKPQKLEKNVQKSGGSGKTYRFDAYFRGWLLGFYVEPIVVFVRLVPTVRVQDVEEMKAAVEDVLGTFEYDGPVRAFLVQTGDGQLSEEVILEANEHFLEYERTVGGRTMDWASPVEVLAEDSSGVYNIGSFYFG